MDRSDVHGQQPLSKSIEDPWTATSVHIHGLKMGCPWTVQIQIGPLPPLLDRSVAE